MARIVLNSDGMRDLVRSLVDCWLRPGQDEAWWAMIKQRLDGNSEAMEREAQQAVDVVGSR